MMKISTQSRTSSQLKGDGWMNFSFEREKVSSIKKSIFFEELEFAFVLIRRLSSSSERLLRKVFHAETQPYHCQWHTNCRNVVKSMKIPSSDSNFSSSFFSPTEIISKMSGMNDEFGISEALQYSSHEYVAESWRGFETKETFSLNSREFFINPEIYSAQHMRALLLCEHCSLFFPRQPKTANRSYRKATKNS